MINVEVINAEAINTVDPGGGRSMINIEAIDNAEAIDTEVINPVDPGGRSMINVEVINDQCGGS